MDFAPINHDPKQVFDLEKGSGNSLYNPDSALAFA